MLQGRGKPAAHHIAQDVENHHIGVFQQVMFLQQLDRLPHDVTATAGARGRTACLDAHHAVIAFEHVVFGPELFRVEIDPFQHVDDRGA